MSQNSAQELENVCAPFVSLLAQETDQSNIQMDRAETMKFAFAKQFQAIESNKKQ